MSISCDFDDGNFLLNVDTAEDGYFVSGVVSDASSAGYTIKVRRNKDGTVQIIIPMEKRPPLEAIP